MLTWKPYAGTQQLILASQEPVCFKFTILLDIREICYKSTVTA